MKGELHIVSLTVTLDNRSTITYVPRTGVVQMLGWHPDGTMYNPVDMRVEQFLELMAKIVKEKSSG